jgi:hypothetical protein
MQGLNAGSNSSLAYLAPRYGIDVLHIFKVCIDGNMSVALSRASGRDVAYRGGGGRGWRG